MADRHGDVDLRFAQVSEEPVKEAVANLLGRSS